jgi:hypothetical protein
VAAFLWLLAGWTSGGLAAYVLGLPAMTGPLLGLAAALFVGWDPVGRIWAPRPDRQRIRRRLADLERVPVESSSQAPRPQAEPVTD